MFNSLLLILLTDRHRKVYTGIGNLKFEYSCEFFSQWKS